MNIKVNLPISDDAAICHRNGWKVGTQLVGDEGHGPEVIEITAIGRDGVLAVRVMSNGAPTMQRESQWALWARKWKEYTP